MVQIYQNKQIMKKVILFVMLLLMSQNITPNNRYQDFNKYLEDYKTQLQNENWERFLKALILVESNGNPKAIGKTNDVGILQITPIYVKEANRLSGKNFTLDDRYSVEKSLEMFSIIQNHYKPDKDIYMAIKLHNPKAGDWYKNRILSFMK